MPYNSWADVVRLSVDRYEYDIKSNVKLSGFRSELQASYVSSHTEELWYNETVCLWMTIYISMVVIVFVNGPGDLGSIPGQVIPKTQILRYLMPPFLTLSIIRYGSRVKRGNPGKGVAPSATISCHSRLGPPTLLYI